MKRIIYLTLVLFALSAFAGATNQVTATGMGNIVDDTIRATLEGYFEISIANDALLSGISIGFIISGTASYHFVGTSSGFLTQPDGVNFVEGIPGSRWMTGDFSDGSCWDLGGTSVIYDPNSSQPNQFLIGGAALTAGLAPGPLQPMLKVYYQAECWYDNYDPKVLCIDSIKYQPAGDFIFVPGGTPAFYVTNGIGGCFPVSNLWCDCPVWDEGIPSSMSLGKCDTGKVTLSATGPINPGDDVYYYLLGVTGGTGTATVGLNDGVVTYIPGPGDGHETVHILIEAADAYHPHGQCTYDPWTIHVTVTNNAPTISCGNSHNIVGSGGLFKKFDITSYDPDACDEIQYEIASITPTPIGTCSIDPVTGILSFYTDNADAGLDYEFCTEAFDGADADTDCFIVTVCNCEIPGDVDGSYDVNIGDAVALIAYIFKGAVGPTNMNWADVNTDCAVNVADAVYLINYIFKGGPEPQVGCYYE